MNNWSSSRAAVITGGTAGIGRATVREFAVAGYDVAVLARGRAGLDAAVSDVVAAGRKGLAVPTDVTDASSVDRAGGPGSPPPLRIGTSPRPGSTRSRRGTVDPGGAPTCSNPGTMTSTAVLVAPSQAMPMGATQFPFWAGTDARSSSPEPRWAVWRSSERVGTES